MWVVKETTQQAGQDSSAVHMHTILPSGHPISMILCFLCVSNALDFIDNNYIQYIVSCSLRNLRGESVCHILYYRGEDMFLAARSQWSMLCWCR